MARTNDTDAHAEALCLLRYVTVFDDNTLVGDDLINRYLLALDYHGLASAPLLDPILRRSPLLLGAVDAVSHLLPDNILRKKLLIAAAIVECNPRSAEALLPRERSRIIIFFSLVGLTLRILLKWIIALPLFLIPSFLKRNARAR